MTCALSARDGRHDGQLVLRAEGGVEHLSVADVLVVAEDVHVAAQGSLVVEEPLAQAGIPSGKLLDGGLDGGSVLEAHLGLPLGEGTKRSRNLHGHGHGIPPEDGCRTARADAPQVGQPGSRGTAIARCRPLAPSQTWRRPAASATSPRRIREARAAMAAPTTPQSGVSTPASAQDGSDPGGGGPSNKHRRHEPTRGTTARSWPRQPSTAPCTRGISLLQQASLAAKRVSNESVPSRTTSAPRRSCAEVDASNRTGRGTNSTHGADCERRRPAATTLKRPTSSSRYRIWRDRLDRSTRSSSTSRSRKEKPATRASSQRKSAAGQPSPPTPRMTAVCVTREPPG